MYFHKSCGKCTANDPLLCRVNQLCRRYPEAATAFRRAEEQSPPDDRRQEPDEATKKADALARQLDIQHMFGVIAEVKAGKGKPGRYYSKTLANRQPAYFHRSCPTCDANARVVDQINKL